MPVNILSFSLLLRYLVYMKKLIVLFILLASISCTQWKKTESVASSESSSEQNFTEVNVVPEDDATKLKKADLHENIIEKDEKGLSHYLSKRGDTYMIIAKKLLGSHTKWREIYNLNKPRLGNSLFIQEGSDFAYQDIGFIEPEFIGFPYLIKKMDNLGKISTKIYGEKKYWEELYYNNKTTIKNPNILFAGFILYYPDQSNMEIVQANMKAENFLQDRKYRLPAEIK
jgi:hypothetical protein